MNEISAVSERNNINYIDNGREPAPEYKSGDILKASLVSRSNGKAYLVTENGFEFSVDNKKVKGETGDVLKFQVKKWSKTGIELKQLENDFDTNVENLTRRLSTKNLAGLMKSHKMLADGKESFTEEQIKTAQKVAKVKAELARAGSTGGASVVAELIQSGLSLSKISTGVLNSIVTESEQRTPVIMSASELTAAVKRSGTESDRAKMIIQALYGQGIHSDEQSVSSLNKFLDKLASLTAPDDNSIMRMLRDGTGITFENIYAAVHAGANSGKQKDSEILSDSEMKNLADEISKIINREGIGENDRNLAEMLVKSGIPLNKDNVEKAKYLKNLDEILKDSGTLEQILDKAAKKLKENKPLNGIELYSRNRAGGTQIDKSSEIDRAKTIIKSLPHYTDADIARASRASKAVTLQSINDAYASRIANDKDFAQTSEPVGETVTAESNELTSDVSQQAAPVTLTPEAVTARRQMEEIRLKLTIQAANSLVGKNLPISIMPLKDVVDSLRNAEREMYSRSLRIVSGAQADTAANIDRLSGLFDKINDTKPVTYNMFADIAQRKVPFTIDGVHESVITAKRAMESYENHATLPAARYGDSFNRIKDQFEKLLTDLNIEASKENIRAAEILSRNKMEIDSSSISEIRAIDAKVTAVQSRLHPSVAAKMIADGLDPSEMHVDEVLEYIDQFNDQYGTDLSQKIAECLLDMDSAEYQDNRDAVIAVYRMLNLIQKDGGAAIGVNTKAGRETTLGNLLDSAKYYSRSKGRKSAGDYKIDDSFGALESLNIPENNIRKLLDDARSKAVREKTEALLDKDGVQEYKDYEDKFNELNLGQTLKNLELIDKLTDEGADSATAKQIVSNIAVIEETLKELAAHASPGAFSHARQRLNGANFKDTELHEMLELLKEYNQTDIIADDAAVQLSELNGISESVIRDAAANGIPLVIGNLNALQILRDNPDFIRQRLNSVANGSRTNNLIKDERNISDSADIVSESGIRDENALEMLESTSIPIPDAELTELKDGVSPEQILSDIADSLDDNPLVREIKLIQNAVKVQNLINRSDDRKTVTIPVRLKDGIAMLNMYVINQKAAGEKTNVYMTVKTNSGATVSARFTLNGDEPPQISADGIEIDDTELGRSLPDDMSSAGLYDIASGILKYIDNRM